MELNGKVALVTGASRGIGRTTAMALARQGADVALFARNADELRGLGEEITAMGRRSLAFEGDIREESQVRECVYKIGADFKRLDVLINNAGVGYFSPVGEMTTAEWDDMFDVNLRGSFLMTREALPMLREHGEGMVVFVASLAGKNTFAGGGGYAASKHALLAFAACLMLEERKNGLRVASVCPGSVETGFGRRPGVKNIPLSKNRLAAEDVAETILHAIRMPQRAMVSEIDIRPSNP